jgi:ABC-type molybdate transport system substrate-binding protein
MPNNNLVISAEDKKRLARAMYQILGRIRITNAQINPLTTAAGLKALAITAGAGLDYYTNETRRIVGAAFDNAIRIDLFTDANVAAANTNAGLLALCTAAGWDPDAASHAGAGDNWWN